MSPSFFRRVSRKGAGGCREQADRRPGPRCIRRVVEPDGVTVKLLAKGCPVVAVANPLRGVRSDAAYLATLLDSIDGPVILVGHSFGGIVISNIPTVKTNFKALVFELRFRARRVAMMTNPGALVDLFDAAAARSALSITPITGESRV